MQRRFQDHLRLRHELVAGRHCHRLLAFLRGMAKRVRVQRIADRREQPLPGAFRESHVHPHRCPRKAFVRAVVERAGRLGGQVAHDRVGLVEDERLRGRQLLWDLA